MEWVAVAIAVIAAAAAVWQAWEARRARIGAQKAATEAESHESRAVDAAERTARAMEEQIAMERTEREKYRDPWTFAISTDKSGVSLELRLGGEEAVHDVTVTKDESVSEYIQTRDEVPSPLRPGQAIYVDWFQMFQSRPQVDVTVAWTRPNGDKHDKVITLP